MAAPAAPAPAGPAPDTASCWRLLGLVVPALDARAGWRRRQRAMGDAEVDANLAMLNRLPAAIEAWSEGNVRVLRAHVVMADGPLSHLARVGGGWWADPDALAPLLEQYLGRPGGFDSAIVLYPADGTPELSPAWGFTWGEVGSLGGIGVSSIVSGDWPRWASIADPEHGFVHEWLHQVEAVYRRLGIGEDDLPGLHDVADRRTARADAPDRVESYVEFERRTGSWRPWYRDYRDGRPQGWGCSAGAWPDPGALAPATQPVVMRVEPFATGTLGGDLKREVGRPDRCRQTVRAAPI